MISRKVLFTFCLLACVIGAYAVSGCIKGERDDTPLTIITKSLPPGQAGAAYLCTLEAIGGTPPYKWTVEEGGSGLPPGLFMSESGNITGTPSTEGSYSFTVKVSDSDNYTRWQTKNLGIEVYKRDDVTVTTAALPPAYVGQAYTAELEAVGGTLPYTWAIVGGGTELTTGLGLYLSDSGLVTGTPAIEGVYPVQVEVTDSSAPPRTDQREVIVTVYEPTEELAIVTNSPLPAATSGSPYDVQFKASGGNNASYTWALELGSAPLPGGLTLNATTGILSGTPTASAGTQFSFSIQVTDADGDTVAKPFVLYVN
jgi:hypothetical protein